MITLVYHFNHLIFNHLIHENWVFFRFNLLILKPFIGQKSIKIYKNKFIVLPNCQKKQPLKHENFQSFLLNNEPIKKAFWQIN